MNLVIKHDIICEEGRWHHFCNRLIKFIIDKYHTGTLREVKIAEFGYRAYWTIAVISELEGISRSEAEYCFNQLIKHRLIRYYVWRGTTDRIIFRGHKEWS